MGDAGGRGRPRPGPPRAGRGGRGRPRPGPPRQAAWDRPPARATRPSWAGLPGFLGIGTLPGRGIPGRRIGTVAVRIAQQPGFGEDGAAIPLLAHPRLQVGAERVALRRVPRLVGEVVLLVRV